MTARTNSATPYPESTSWVWDQRRSSLEQHLLQFGKGIIETRFFNNRNLLQNLTEREFFTEREFIHLFLHRTQIQSDQDQNFLCSI